MNTYYFIVVCHDAFNLHRELSDKCYFFLYCKDKIQLILEK